MQAANRLSNALLKGGPSFGAWQMLPGANLSRILARTSPDWICVDCEHGNISDEAMHESVAAIAACNVSPIVRITHNEDWLVKRALDAGAHGVLVPMIYSAQDAMNIVRAAKFPPQGRRGFGSPFSMEKFHTEKGGPVPMMDYLAQANSSLLTIVQIETAEALAAVSEIANVEGIDVLLIGPFDLGNMIGHPMTVQGMPDKLREAIHNIRDAAHAAGKKVGIYATSAAQAKQYADTGFDMISAATDVNIIQDNFTAAFATARGT